MPILTTEQQAELNSQLKKIINEKIDRDAIYSLIAQGADWKNILLHQNVLNDFELVKGLYEIDRIVFVEALKARGKYGDTPLLKAVRHEVSNLQNIVNFFLEHGAELTVRNEYNANILHFAVDTKKLQYIEWLYTKKPTEFQAMLKAKNGAGKTPLLAAVSPKDCNIEIVKFLAGKGAKITSHSGLDETILHMPGVLNSLELITWLGITYPKKFNEMKDYKDNEGRTPLLKTMLSRSKDSESCFNSEVIKYLISQGADIGEDNNDNCTLFHSPLIYKNLELLEWIIKTKPEECSDVINWRNSDCHPPLFIAEKVSIEAVLFLLRNGADVTGYDSDHLTILTKKSILKNPDILKSIRDINKASFDEALDIEVFYKDTVLEMAADAGYKTSVEFLLENLGLDFRYNNGDSILHKTPAISLGKEVIIRLHDKDPHAFAKALSTKNIFGDTPLMKAVILIRSLDATASDAVKLFLELGAEIPASIDFTSNIHNQNVAKKIFEAAQFADNILAKLENPGVPTTEEGLANLTANFDMISKRIINKAYATASAPSLSSYISYIGDILPELKSKFLKVIEDKREECKTSSKIDETTPSTVSGKKEESSSTEAIAAQLAKTTVMHSESSAAGSSSEVDFVHTSIECLGIDSLIDAHA